MNIKTSLKSTLKTLPLLTMLTAGLVLSPTLAMAGNNDRGHGSHKSSYSHDRGQSHKNKDHRRGGNKHGNKHAYNNRGRSHDKHRKDNHGHKSKHYNKKHHYYNNHSYNRHDHHAYRNDRHNHYVVNDHYYRDRLFDLDRLRFMIGLHTDNFDITFRD